jgi:hypothetical protein
MESSYLICLFIGSLLSALIAFLIIKHPLKLILHGLVEESIATAFAKVIHWGLLLISILSGVGFPSKVHSYEGYYASGGGYSWPATPNTSTELFLLFYKSSAAAMVGISSLLGVILFTCLILHVVLVRTKLVEGNRDK